MKKIKSFSELRSDTYYSASDKLSQMGHYKRSSSMSMYADEVEEREIIEDWTKFIKDQIKFGVIDVYIDGVICEMSVMIEFTSSGNMGMDSLICVLVPINIDDFKVYNKTDVYYDNIRYLTLSYNSNKEIRHIKIFNNFNTNGYNYNINIDRRNAIKLRTIISKIVALKYDGIELSENIKTYSINQFYSTTNEELNYSTYTNASDKLKINHPKRAKELLDWSEELKDRKDRNEYEDMYNKYSKYGKFNIEVAQSIYTSKTRKIVKEDLEDCVFNISFDFDYNSEYLCDNPLEKNDSVVRGSLSFDIFIIPNTYELFKKYREEYLSILIPYNLSKNSLEFLNTIDLVDISFNDRPSAGRFRNLLKKIFSKNSDYPSSGDGKMCDVIEYKFFAEKGISSDYGVSIEDLYKIIDNIPANKLYKEK